MNQESRNTPQRVILVGIVILLFLLSTGNALATDVGGAITTDTTWTLTGSPYIVTGNITVYGSPSNTVTLTIEPGVEVRFHQNTGFAVGSTSSRGTLLAQGTTGAPIDCCQVAGC